MIHVAFLHKRHIDNILCGKKTIESRLSVNKPLAWSVERNDIILFKEVSGEIRVKAIVGTVHNFDRLTSNDISVLANLFSLSVGITENDPYWQMKINSRYAVFIELTSISPISFPASLTPRGVQSAWIRNFIVPENHLMSI